MKLAMYLSIAVILFITFDGLSSWMKLPEKAEINESTYESMISTLGAPYEEVEEKYISWKGDGIFFKTVTYISYEKNKSAKCKFIKKKLFINAFVPVAIFEYHG